MAIDDRYAEEDFTTEEMFIPELPELPELPEPPEFVSRGEDSVPFGPEAEIDVEILEPPDILDLYGDEDDRSPVQAQSQPENTTPAQEAPAKEDKGEPEIEEPADNDESKEKKVKGVEKTGDHESLWSKIKNGFKKVKEFVQNLSEALRTHDISMFKAWVYGGKRLVNTLVETDITNNAIKQKEALAINESLAAQVKELEAKLEEIQKQQNEEPDIPDKPTSEEKTTEMPIIQVTTESMREAIDGQKERIRDCAGALEAAKAEETPDKEKIAKLSEGLLEQYAALGIVYKNIKDSLYSDEYEFSSSPEEISQFAESLQADVEEMSGIVTEVFKTEIEEEELSEPDVEEHLEDDAPSTPGVKEKIEILNEQARGAADVLAAELGANDRVDPSSTIDKNGPSFDDDM